MNRSLSRAALLAAAVCVGGCAKDPTAIYVRVSGDSLVSTAVRSIVVRVYDGADTSMMPMVLQERVIPITPGRAEYTLLVEDSGRYKSVRIEVEGYLTMVGGGRDTMPGTGFVNDRATVTWVNDKVLSVSMRLRDSCRYLTRVGTQCMPTQRCIADGSCVPASQNDAAPYSY